MNGLHYIRALMIERLASESRHDPRPVVLNSGLPVQDDQHRRFRRMAENRKRQMLERMLLDETTEGCPMRSERPMWRLKT
jgi:hypothetical protein